MLAILHEAPAASDKSTGIASLDRVVVPSAFAALIVTL